MIKTREEIEKIKKATKITDDAFSYILPFIKIGESEIFIKDTLEKYLIEKGDENLSFDTICVSGENGAKPHGVPSHKMLAFGDALTLDFGAMYDGYCSDMTRTVFIGKAEGEIKKLYDLVLEAQLKVLDSICAGKSCFDMDKIARDFFFEKGYGKYFIHGLGHGLGKEVHEEPYLSPKGDKILEPNMVVTVEPGLYIEGLGGIRIEDTVLITENGCEILTKSEKGIIIL